MMHGQQNIKLQIILWPTGSHNCMQVFVSHNFTYLRNTPTHRWVY